MWRTNPTPTAATAAAPMTTTPQINGTACKTCRRRGRKCDKRLPTCASCAAKGLPCEGYVLRWAGLASRGKFAGKSIPVTTSSPGAGGDGPRRLSGAAARGARPAKKAKRERERERDEKARREPVVKNEEDEDSVPILRDVPALTHESSPETTTSASSFSHALPDPADAEIEGDQRSDYLVPDFDDQDDAAAVLAAGISEWRPLILRQRLGGSKVLELDDPERGEEHEEDGEEGLEVRVVTVEPQRVVENFTKIAHTLDPFNIPLELKHILSYHVLEVVPKLTVDFGFNKNPYSQYILPLAFEYPSLLYACAALAACHYNVRLRHQIFYLQGLRFRGKAIRQLQEDLYDERRARDDGTLATILMLSLVDICLGGLARFDAHFAGARRLIQLRGGARTCDSFVEHYLIWLDTMAAASTSTRQPVFSPADIASLLDPAAREWHHDVYPCPLDQFQLVHQIVHLYKAQRDPARPPRAVLQRVRRLKSELVMAPMHTERDENWLHLTEAFRHALIIYLLRLFPGAGREDDGEGEDEEEADGTQGLPNQRHPAPPPSDPTPSPLEAEITDHAHTVFYHVASVPANTGFADQLLWPVFHAALELREPWRRDWLRARARAMQASGGFGNVDTAMRIVERVWGGWRARSYLEMVSGVGLEGGEGGRGCAGEEAGLGLGLGMGGGEPAMLLI